MISRKVLSSTSLLILNSCWLELEADLNSTKCCVCAVVGGWFHFGVPAMLDMPLLWLPGQRHNHIAPLESVCECVCRKKGKKLLIRRK